MPTEPPVILYLARSGNMLWAFDKKPDGAIRTDKGKGFCALLDEHKYSMGLPNREWGVIPDGACAEFVLMRVEKDKSPVEPVSECERRIAQLEARVGTLLDRVAAMEE
jgi:hypothetical protein